MMLKYCRIGVLGMALCLLLVVLCCADVEAQTRNKHNNGNARKTQKNDYNDHYFSTSVSGGYSLFLNNSKDISLRGGGGGALAIGYEFRKPSKRVWFSLAAEYQLLTSSIKTSFSIYDRWITDSEGRLAMYHYDMLNGSDKQMSMAIGVPFMIGYCHNGFYIGAGPKLSYFFWGQADSKLDYQTHATYDRYIDEYEDMPNHYYTTNSVNGKSKMTFNSISASICFEAGYDIMRLVESRRTYSGSGKPRTLDWIYMLKLGFYAEYGFLDINSSQPTGTAYSYVDTNPFMLNVKPFYTTETPTDMALRPFYAGVRLTFLVTAVCGRCRGKAKVF